jgi:DNA-binding SARP family transcriptional activator
MAVGNKFDKSIMQKFGKSKRFVAFVLIVLVLTVVPIVLLVAFKNPMYFKIFNSTYLRKFLSGNPTYGMWLEVFAAFAWMLWVIVFFTYIKVFVLFVVKGKSYLAGAKFYAGPVTKLACHLLVIALGISSYKSPGNSVTHSYAYETRPVTFCSGLSSNLSGRLDGASEIEFGASNSCATGHNLQSNSVGIKISNVADPDKEKTNPTGTGKDFAYGAIGLGMGLSLPFVAKSVSKLSNKKSVNSDAGQRAVDQPELLNFGTKVNLAFLTLKSIASENRKSFQDPYFASANSAGVTLYFECVRDFGDMPTGIFKKNTQVILNNSSIKNVDLLPDIPDLFQPIGKDLDDVIFLNFNYSPIICFYTDNLLDDIGPVLKELKSLGIQENIDVEALRLNKIKEHPFQLYRDSFEENTSSEIIEKEKVLSTLFLATCTNDFDQWGLSVLQKKLGKRAKLIIFSNKPVMGALNAELNQKVMLEPLGRQFSPIGLRLKRSDKPVAPQLVLYQDEDNQVDWQEDFASEGPEVVVSVLGSVTIEGTACQVYRPRIIESIVYLALHPNGVSKSTWAAAIWPDRIMGRDSLNTIISSIRQALGTSYDGKKRFPHSTSGKLKLSSAVTTDIFLFKVLASTDNPEDWKAALDLVRGRPFDGLKEPTWLIADGFMATAENAIVDTAIKLAEHCFDIDLPQEAMAAARTALNAVPYDERLWRIVLRATHSLGNGAGVDAVMDEIKKVMETEDLNGLSSQTIDLFMALKKAQKSVQFSL